MVRAFTDYAAVKMGAFSGKTADDPIAQITLAEASAAIEEMKTVLFVNLATLNDYAEADEVPPIELRLRFKYQASSVASRCAALAARLYRYCGGSGLFLDQPFSWLLANLHAAGQHAGNAYEK